MTLLGIAIMAELFVLASNRSNGIEDFRALSRRGKLKPRKERRPKLQRRRRRRDRKRRQRLKWSIK
jgi:hypothetical protein